MSIVRVLHNKENPFVQINKKGLWDPDLPLSVIGLWTRLLSRPDDWELNAVELAKSCNVNVNTIYKYLNILIQHGYGYREQERKDGKKKNQFNNVKYYVFEFKVDKEEIQKMFSAPGFSARGTSAHGKTGITKKEHTKKEYTNNKQQRKPKSRGSPKASPSSRVMPAGGVSPAEGVSFAHELGVIREMLAKFNLPKKTLNDLSKFSPEHIRIAIQAFEQYCQKKKPDNPIACLTTAIKNGWKPKPDKPDKQTISNQELMKTIQENRLIVLAMIKRFEYKFNKTFRITDRMTHAELSTKTGFALMHYNDLDCIKMLQYYIEMNK